MRNLLIATVSLACFIAWPALAQNNSNNTGTQTTTFAPVTTQTCGTSCSSGPGAVGTQNVQGGSGGQGGQGGSAKVVGSGNSKASATAGPTSVTTGPTNVATGGSPVTIEEKRSAYAPSIGAPIPTAPCMFGTSIGGAIPIAGASISFSHKDDQCAIEAAAQSWLYTGGRPDVAFVYLCSLDGAPELVAQAGGAQCPGHQQPHPISYQPSPAATYTHTEQSTVTVYPAPDKPNSYDRTYARPSANGVN